jgi:CBS domain-containing protein
MKVNELMNEDVLAVGPETPLKDVAAILAERGISGLPVISERRTVLGVVSEADILVKEQGPEARHGGIFGWLLDGGAADDERLAARTAGEAMTSPAITIGANTHVSWAARMMTEHAIKRLPVVDWNDVLVGIITRADLVRAFARTDAEIEREIREEVVRQALWIDDDRDLEVQVHRGEVKLAGEFERRSDAELLPDFVARVPGVVSVRSTLTWRWDDRKASPEKGLVPGAFVPPR